MEFKPISFGDCLSEWIQIKGLTVPQLAALLGYEREDALEPILHNEASFEYRLQCLEALGSYGLLTAEERLSLAAILSSEFALITGLCVTLDVEADRVALQAKTADGCVRIEFEPIL